MLYPLPYLDYYHLYRVSLHKRAARRHRRRWLAKQHKKHLRAIKTDRQLKEIRQNGRRG